jgi:hypothetical protein
MGRWGQDEGGSAETTTCMILRASLELELKPILAIEHPWLPDILLVLVAQIYDFFSSFV